MVKGFREYVKKLRKPRFMPKYMICVDETKDGTPLLKEISRKELCQKLSKLPKGKYMRIWRSWVDPETGIFTEPKEYMVGLTLPRKGKKPLVIFKVYEIDRVYVTNGSMQTPKWVPRGTVAISSLLQGRDCIGCEGERYTKEKHLEIKHQLLLEASKTEKSLVTNIIIGAKRNK